MDLAFAYLEKHNVCTEQSYPYLAKQGTCMESNCSVAVPKGSIVGFKDVSAQDTEALMEAVAQQPVSVAIEADQMAFQLYRGGILSQECGKKLDHGVLVVGYGTEDGVDYWKVLRLAELPSPALHLIYHAQHCSTLQYFLKHRFT